MKPEELKRRLKLLGNLKLPRTLMHRFGIIARDTRKKRFRWGISPDGTPWESLAESTIKQKKAKGGRARKNAEFPLIREEKLMNLRIHAEDNRCVLNPEEDRKNISMWHNQGTSRIPKREHMGLYEGAEEAILKERDKYVEDQIKRIMSY